MSFIGRLPIQGKISFSNWRITFWAVVGAQVGSFLAYHSRATASKVFSSGFQSGSLVNGHNQ